MLVEKYIELNNGNKIYIQKTKQEPMFTSFGDNESSSKKIITEISESPVLRQILFLKSIHTMTVESPAAISMAYPFCLDPEFNFKEKLEDRKDYRDTQEKLEERIKKCGDIAINVIGNSLADTLETYMNDAELNRILKSRHPTSYEIFELMKKTIKEKREISQDHSNMVSFFSSMYELQMLTRIKTYMEISENAHSNSKAINQSIKLPERTQQITDAFSKLTKHPVTLGMETLCLDCYFTENRDPYYSQVTNAKTIHLQHMCERCGGKGLVHKILIGYPSSISKLLMPESHWLHELIMGFAVNGIDSIKEIYIHKKIHAVINGQIQEGIESDITIITKDNRLILGEVTTQSSADNIMNEITKKGKKLERAQIPYDKMIYFSSHEQDYFTQDAFRTRIFGLRHLYDIKNFVKQWIEPEHIEKPTPIVN